MKTSHVNYACVSFQYYLLCFNYYTTNIFLLFCVSTGTYSDFFNIGCCPRLSVTHRKWFPTGGSVLLKLIAIIAAFTFLILFITLKKQKQEFLEET